jgi:hypothetical protein
LTERPPRKADLAKGSDDPLESLFGVAGKRTRLAPDEVTPIRETARAAWRRSVRRTRARRTAIFAAGLAAGIVLLVGLLTRERTATPAAPVALGALELANGAVAVDRDAAAGLEAGSRVTTGGDGRVAVRLAGGASVRIDVSSRVRFESPTRVALERGALYVDADPRSPGAAVTVATPLATVRHVGTQFEVRLLGGSTESAPGAGALRVTVREGLVEVRQDERTYQAAAGAALTLRGNGVVERDVAPAQGPPWEWTQRAAPALAIEGTTLATFLAWVSRETGLPWRYADATLEESTHSTLLHGSIDGLTPEEGLAVVLPGCGMRHRRSEGALLLELAAP